MSRMVCVWLPHLPIERLTRETVRTGFAPPPDDRPFALVGNDTRGLILTAVNPVSARNGLLPGLGLADARAICPQLLTAPAAPDKDAEALLALARWASRYSPTLNVDGADGLWLDITGVSHLFGGERALLADLATRLARLGLSARLGAAETQGAAYALAHFAKNSPSITPDGALRSALAPFPVEALRLEPDTVHLLRRLGLKRIGQLYALPRASLERRFHSKETAENVLRRLDQALGVRPETRTPLLPAPDFTVRRVFAEPLITHDGVIAALDHLAGALCQALTQGGHGARRVTLWAARTDGSAATIEAGLSAPSRTDSHLVRLLQDKIEDIDMGFGVDLMMLAALATEPLRDVQANLTADTTAITPETLIDALANRLGARAVRRLFPQASHIPELAQVSCSAFAGLPSWIDADAGKPTRPLFLLAKPEPLAVMAEIPEGPPARFTWRRVNRRVTKVQGPERIAPQWWQALNARTTARPRDYYRIEDTDGCRYWVFREGLYKDSAEPPCWFLHGVFP
jgi:protein ImuB